MRSEIRHETAQRRFTLAVGESLAYITYREVDPNTIDFDHTFVPPPLRGGGVASQLTQHALRHAQTQRLKVIASCPFVARYIERHAEFRELLV
jgi:predicted GNAT family acetyltransferase